MRYLYLTCPVCHDTIEIALRHPTKESIEALKTKLNESHLNYCNGNLTTEEYNLVSHVRQPRQEYGYVNSNFIIEKTTNSPPI